MSKPTHTLSFSSDGDSQLFIHADADGLDYLIRSLSFVRRKLDDGACEHDHLMTGSWGGCELTERTLDEGAKTIHHVKIYGWTPEWIQKHGLSA